MLRTTLTSLLASISAACLGQAISNYHPGDWVSYTNCRYVTAIGRGFNTVYFGTTGGILRWDTFKEKWLDPLTVSDGMPENRVRRMVVDRMTDELWIETPLFSAHYQPAFYQWTNEPFPAQNVQPPGITIAELPQFFPPMGYNYFARGYLVGRDLNEYPITQLLRDEGGVTWMGLWGLGPAKGDLRRSSLELLPFGPYDSDVARLLVDGDDLWFLGGSNGMPGSITLYRRESESWVYFQPRYVPGIISDQFYCLSSDSGGVWLGTELGLVRYFKKTGSFTAYREADGIYGARVTAVLPVRDNVIIGSDEGVSVFDLKRDSIYSATTDDIRGHLVFDLAQRDKRIYAATDMGIFYLEWGGSDWTRYLLPVAYLRSEVYDMQIVDSLLYAVSSDAVAIINLSRDSYQLYDRNAFFQNSLLMTLLVHQGVAWVGGENGLYRLNPRTNHWYRYTMRDGLIGEHVTSLAADGDYIWIGTDQGATRFFWKDYSRRDWLD